jgi:hypothetical protein
MSTQPGDPRPQDAAPDRTHDGDGETGTPPPGFGAQVKALVANPYVKILIAIVAVLLIVLVIIVANSDESSSDGPEPGAATPAVRVVAAAPPVLAAR